jgi:hypothetical protein
MTVHFQLMYAKARYGNADYCLARAFAVKPSRRQERRDPRGALGLDGSARPSRGGLHALECKDAAFAEHRTPRLGAKGMTLMFKQSNSHTREGR